MAIRLGDTAPDFTAESTLGQGTTFTVSLPVARAAKGNGRAQRKG